jgi:RHS repeat-associated protein
MPGRNGTISGGEYRYAFNGMETDKEVSGGGNSYTTQFRQYDPRLGRWKSLDPLAGKYPNQSPFCAFDNNPIYYTDPLGLEAGGPGDPPQEFSSEAEKDAYLDGLSSSAKNGQKEFYNIDGEAYLARFNKRTGNWDIYIRHPDKNSNTWVPNGTTKTEEKKEESDPPKPKPFAIYVAYPDAPARVGKGDGSDIANDSRKLLGNKSLPVGHTGIVIGDGLGNTYYFDFGRFGTDVSVGITRSSETNNKLNTTGATFGDDGHLNNTSDIVKNLVYGNNSYFKEHLNNYGNVMFAYYPDLDFDAMYAYATGHGSKKFGFEEGSSFCTKFANDVIRAGGGELDVITDRINDNKAKLIKEILLHPRNLKKVTEQRYVPTPNNYVKDIQEKYPKLNPQIKL